MTMLERTQPYEIIPGERYPQPICHLSLIGQTRRVPVKALVDSGATFSVFPKSTAQDAGIPLPIMPNEHIRFGSGTVKGYKTRSYLWVFGARVKADIVFVETLPYRYALLGRIGVFSKFREIAFCEKAQRYAVRG